MLTSKKSLYSSVRSLIFLQAIWTCGLDIIWTYYKCPCVRFILGWTTPLIHTRSWTLELSAFFLHHLISLLFLLVAASGISSHIRLACRPMGSVEDRPLHLSNCNIWSPLLWSHTHRAASVSTSACSPPAPPPLCSPQEEFNPDGGMWTRRILIKRPGPDAAWFVVGLDGEKRDGDSCSCCVSRLNVNTRLRRVCSLVRCRWTNAVVFNVALPAFFVLQIHTLLHLTHSSSLLWFIFFVCLIAVSFLIDAIFHNP